LKSPVPLPAGKSIKCPKCAKGFTVPAEPRQNGPTWQTNR
jgi:hypothetical protein